MRGIAAVAVVCNHFIQAFFPALVLGAAAISHTRFEDNIQGTPLAIFFAGYFAVVVFFMLSGFVLSIGFFKTSREEIIKKLAIKRYFRLMLPALASVILAYLLINFGAVKLIESASAITQSKWLGNAWGVDMSFFQTLYHGSIGIFLDGTSPLNNVLWTMKIEFFGSFLVFAFLLLFAKSSYRWIGYAVLTAFTFNTWYLAFVVGMAMADAYAMGWLERLKKKALVAPILFSGALILGAYPQRPGNTIYEVLNVDRLIGGFSSQIFYLTVAAFCLMMGVLLSSKVSTWLQRPLFGALGKYSFGLYLTHLVVLYTVTTSVFIVFYPLLGYELATFTAYTVSIPAVVAMAIFYTRFVDMPSVKLSQCAYDIYTGKKRMPNVKLLQKFHEDSMYLAVSWRVRVAESIKNDYSKLHKYGVQY